MPDVPGFLPSTRGLPFDNSWPSQPGKTIATPFGRIGIGNASRGLCGGMVFAARDYFEAGLARPDVPRPSPGQPLYDFIVARSFASFHLPRGPIRYYGWMLTKDRDTWLRSGVASRTALREWPAIRRDLDRGMLSCLGLVTVFSPDPRKMRHNHQVLAYGYDVAGGDLTLKLYDPNSPLRDDIRLSLDLGDPARGTPIRHNVGVRFPVRGFFRVPYAPASPPRIADAGTHRAEGKGMSLPPL